MRLPVVALVGRPNVGKSTLFNRLVGGRQAVVDRAPGVTRDRNASLGDWCGRSYYLVDTGGWYPGATGGMEARIGEQVAQALQECDLVLFLADAREGLQALDEEISQALLCLSPRPPVLLVVNKVDGEHWEAHAHEFRGLGWEGLLPISAMEGRGIGELLDALVAALPAGGSREERDAGIRIAVLGRPNVGKSSLTNRIVGAPRVIVDPQPGTTRDAIDTPLRWHGRTLWVVDTAGIRHHWDRLPAFEFYASLRSVRALERSQIALLVLDGTEPVTRQDQRIASVIEESGRAVLILVNKWDLVVKETQTAVEREREIREDLPNLSYAPVLFVSALTGQRVSRIPAQAVALYEESRRKVGTAEINKALERAVEQTPPRGVRGRRRPRILYATQVRIGPPTFALFVRHAQSIAPEYLRYLARRFREAFGFSGSPIVFRVREATGRTAKRGGKRR